MAKWQKLAISLAIPLLAATVGAAVTVAAIPGWYAALLKPSFSPPNWLFGPVWTWLYLLMGFALYLVLIDTTADRSVARNACIVFSIQLVLNVAWSIAFFSAHNLVLSLVVIAALWLLILWNILVFKKINRVAAMLLVPYLAWVTFAAVLNVAIWQLNG